MDFIIIVIITIIVGLYNVGVGHGFAVTEDDIDEITSGISNADLELRDIPMRTNIEMKFVEDAWCDIVKELGLM